MCAFYAYDLVIRRYGAGVCVCVRKRVSGLVVEHGLSVTLLEGFRDPGLVRRLLCPCLDSSPTSWTETTIIYSTVSNRLTAEPNSVPISLLALSSLVLLTDPLSLGIPAVEGSCAPNTSSLNPLVPRQ